jgi:hypothetical protein
MLGGHHLGSEDMSQKEKLALAEAFVRKAVSHFSGKVSERKIKEAAKEAAKSLPPYKEPKATRRAA